MSRVRHLAEALKSSRQTVLGNVKKASIPLAKKILDVAVVGLPNAGKSSLINLIIGKKVAAVSRKRNTTRQQTLGVWTTGNTQIVFYDTPGAIQKRDSIAVGRAVSASPAQTMCQVDRTLLVIDVARKIDKKTQQSIDALIRSAITHQSADQISLVLNKVDLVNKEERIQSQLATIKERITLCKSIAQVDGDDIDAGDPSHPLKEDYGASGVGIDLSFPTFRTSATTGAGLDGLDGLKQHLIDSSHEGAWRYGGDVCNPASLEEQVAEVVREVLYNTFHREIPYSIQQEHRSFYTVPAAGHFYTSTGSNNDSSGSSSSDRRVVLVVDHDLIVQSKAHARILTGRKRSGGNSTASSDSYSTASNRLRYIENCARRAVMEMVGPEIAGIDLRLHVKVQLKGKK